MNRTMPAVVNYAPEPHSVELREVPVPEIGDDDVLLAVQAVGVCGTDIHVAYGQHRGKINYPVILGHEFGGVIVKTGKNVHGFKEGDRVVSETAAVIDETSPFVHRGLYNLDPGRRGYGFGVDGAMTHYTKVPQRILHHIPDTLSFEVAALTEPCCVAYNATCGNARILPGDAVAVIGPGPIGLLCAAMAKLAGAGDLVVIGTPADARRLQIAGQIGASATLGAQGEDIVAWTRSLRDGYGFDVVIDAAGVSPTLKLALDIVRPAGQISKVGWGQQPFNFSLDPLVHKAVTLQGSFSHNWPIWERVIFLLASGQLDFGKEFSHIFQLAEWHEAFAAMHSAEIVKAVLLPWVKENAGNAVNADSADNTVNAERQTPNAERRTEN
ncbi:MAG: zinc-binding dehydrogenase [Verrucomicrobia bacterium]|nr:zinc-binding dehydrogenase [Verrucomicrobiota bacterium]